MREDFKYSLFFLFSLMFTVSFSGELNLPEIYNETVLDNDEWQVLKKEYDINKDNKKDIVLIHFKLDEENIDSVYSGYIKSEEGENILKFQTSKAFKLDEDFYSNLDSYINYFADNISGIVNEEGFLDIDFYDNSIPNNMSINNIKYTKNIEFYEKDFLFIQKKTYIRNKPNFKSDALKELYYGSKLGTIAKIKYDNGQEWYKVVSKDENNNEINGFISSSVSVKRKYDLSKMKERMDGLNSFIKKTLDENGKLYIIDAYIPLSKDKYSIQDEFGNRANQSIRAYKKEDLTGKYINIPDRTIVNLLESKNNYYKIETDVYGGPYYIDRYSGALKELKDVNGEITKFIAVDTKNQTEVAFEKKDDTWDIVTYSFVTTGKDNGGSSYSTPYGSYLIDFAKPRMLYTRNKTAEELNRATPKNRRVPGKRNLILSGYAEYAIRFSGGGYLHGLPGGFEEKREKGKKNAEKKIGTYKFSHKCVRHYDDQIKFLYDWIGNSTPNSKIGHRKPEIPTGVIVL